LGVLRRRWILAFGIGIGELMGMCHVGDGEHWWLVQLLHLQLNRLDHQLDLDHEMAVGLDKHLSPRLALLLLLH